MALGPYIASMEAAGLISRFLIPAVREDVEKPGLGTLEGVLRGARRSDVVGGGRYSGWKSAWSRRVKLGHFYFNFGQAPVITY